MERSSSYLAAFLLLLLSWGCDVPSGTENDVWLEAAPGTRFEETWRGALLGLREVWGGPIENVRVTEGTRRLRIPYEGTRVIVYVFDCEGPLPWKAPVVVTTARRETDGGLDGDVAQGVAQAISRKLVGSGLYGDGEWLRLLEELEPR